MVISLPVIYRYSFKSKSVFNVLIVLAIKMVLTKTKKTNLYCSLLCISTIQQHKELFQFIHTTVIVHYIITDTTRHTKQESLYKYMKTKT